jgi:hypothetical protein
MNQVQMVPDIRPWASMIGCFFVAIIIIIIIILNLYNSPV